MCTALASSATTLHTLRQHQDHKTNEKFTLHITRFNLIETAEETRQWASRAKSQWGDNEPIVIHVSFNTVRCGTIPPQKITYSVDCGWAGVAWGRDTGLDLPLLENPVLQLEVAIATHPSETIGLGILNAQAMLAEGRQYAKYCVHVFPTRTSIDSETVHAVVHAEIHAGSMSEPPESNLTPLEYNYGSVRVSTIDFYYPSFLLTGTGQYIVSNVICAMNMTESSSLAMQLVPLKGVSAYINTEPSQVITVRPQQRVYFSATWVISKTACMRTIKMQLRVNGSQQPSASIIIKVHNTVPQPTTTDIPYHYWVNTACITNRQMLPSQELPILCAILPVHRFLSSGPIDQREGMIVAFDKDKGEQVLVRANGLPVAMGRSGVQGDRWTRGASSEMGIAASDIGDLFADSMLDMNASFVIKGIDRGNALPSRGPLLDLSQKTCLCTIVLGPIRGFPMVCESSTGVSPSFQVSITLLDPKGWQILHGETLPSYQSASGSLRWGEKLLLRKWPGADPTQFLRLNLTEVRPRDGDETPIGAGLISLNSMSRIYVVNSLSVAFYIYETYSLYDQLNSPNLLMKDLTLMFSEVR